MTSRHSFTIVDKVGKVWVEWRGKGWRENNTHKKKMSLECSLSFLLHPCCHYAMSFAWERSHYWIPAVDIEQKYKKENIIYSAKTSKESHSKSVKATMSTSSSTWSSQGQKNKKTRRKSRDLQKLFSIAKQRTKNSSKSSKLASRKPGGFQIIKK